MVRQINVIGLDEQSDEVANLHSAMRSLGIAVDETEALERRAGKVTTTMVRLFQQQAGIKPSEEFLVDEPTAAAMNVFLSARGLVSLSAVAVVVGRITETSGAPQRGLTVTAYDQDLRKRRIVGQATSDADGKYLIQYELGNLADGLNARADLVIEVADPAGHLLFSSPPVFNAGSVTVVDAKVEQRSSEYALIAKALNTLVIGQDVTVADLEEDDSHSDITFASGETGIDAFAITAFVVAQRLAGKADLPAEFWFGALRSRALSFDVAVQKPGIQTLSELAFASITTSPARTVRDGLVASLEANHLDTSDQVHIDAWIDVYDRLQSETLSDATPLTQRLRQRAGLSDGARVDWTVLLKRDVDPRSATGRLRESAALDDTQVERLQTGVKLNDLLLGDLGLFDLVSERIATAADLPALGRLAPSEVTELIRRSATEPPPYVSGTTLAERQDSYGRLIARRLATAYPTAAFAGRLDRAETRWPGQRDRMAEFLRSHPDFDLATTSVDGFVKERVHEAQDASFIDEMKAVQRVFKLNPEFDAVATLLEDKLHSAAQIYRMGRKQFVTSFATKPGFTALSAERTFERAANTQGALLTVIGELRALRRANAVMSLKNGAPALDALPEWSSLFGPADACSYDDCASVFSPAAYLTDLLKWLDGRKLDAGRSAKDVLFERRPDIGNIELTCANTKTQLPYIDLVCEILEDEVADEPTFDAPFIAFAPGPPRPALRAAFAGEGIVLSSAARVSGPDHYGAWLVRDAAVTYRAAFAGTLNMLAVVELKQTHRTAEELNAYPEYRNSKAYDLLLKARRPLALPFDLFAESARSYLGLVNLTRSEVMLTFSKAGVADQDIACEALGISTIEQPLIFITNTADQYLFWGAANNAAAIAELTIARTFSGRTGLDFADIQRLLSLQFVNPDGAISIRYLDASCELDRIRIEGLDEEALDRIHRFLRLWRKLGWQMWELDLAIANPKLANGHLEMALAVNLFHLLRIRKRIPTLSIEQLCAFFADISTNSKFTKAYQNATPSFYEHLFLNKRVAGTPDPAFAMDKVGAGSLEPLDNHLAPIAAATKLRISDLELLRTLRTPAGDLYVGDKLTLGNLSSLYRHALLARRIGIKITDWQKLLDLLQADPFASAEKTLEFIMLVDRLRNARFSIDQLAYTVGGDTAVKSAIPAKTIGNAATAIRTSLKGLVDEYDVDNLPTDPAGLSDSIATRLQEIGWNGALAADAVSVLRGAGPAAATETPKTLIQLKSNGPAGYVFNRPDQMPISYDGTNGVLSFSGVMTDAQLATLTSNAVGNISTNAYYQEAIRELYDLPRLLVGRYLPQSEAPLAALPVAVVFDSLTDKDLAARIGYDAARGFLTFVGVMTRSEKVALSAMSAEPAYLATVQALYDSARAPAAGMTWMSVADLGDELPTLSKAAARLTAFARDQLSADLVVQQTAAFAGVTPPIAALLTTVAIFGPMHQQSIDQLLRADGFVSSDGAITPDAFGHVYSAFYWLHRCAMILKIISASERDIRWLLSKPDLKNILDLSDLPPAAAVGTSASLVLALLRLTEIMQLHHRLSDGMTSLLDIIDRLVAPGAAYPSLEFSHDLESLAGWEAADVRKLVATFGTVYPQEYASADAWRRLVAAFDIIQRLPGSAEDIVEQLATADVDAEGVELLRGILRAQYSEVDWLTNDKTVQDALRERKRDCLTAYLLTEAPPAVVPWRNPSDLLDYYLIDVQMGSAQPTTRLVQAYASVQMFVQRCLMGLEPEVEANSDADDGWTQWQWMRSYRLWEANRRVYVFPENYAEPELRRNKSELFVALEDVLLQGGITREKVETAYLAYLDGLDDVAQLDIAGHYYEEKKRVLHVFGRSAGGDPRLYYYRQFIEGRRWTPWSKVDLDVKGDYLTPFVLNNRLFAVWLEFQEVASSHQVARVPAANSSVDVNADSPSNKNVNILLAMSELRNGKWTKKRLAAPQPLSKNFSGQVDYSQFVVMPLDLTWLPEQLYPYGVPKTAPKEDQWRIDGTFLIGVNSPALERTLYYEVTGCGGSPETFEGELSDHLRPVTPQFVGDQLVDDRNIAVKSQMLETAKGFETPNGNTLYGRILEILPSRFSIRYPHYMSLMDRGELLKEISAAYDTVPFGGRGDEIIYAPLGKLYDWFYSDRKRTFHVRPEFIDRQTHLTMHYEDVLELIKDNAGLDDLNKAAGYLNDYVSYGADIRLGYHIFYHPLTCQFISRLYRGGVDLLLSRETQFADGGLEFKDAYQPTGVVDDTLYPREIAVFDDPASGYAHGYASYNWELFYFAPLMIAQRLSANQQFEEALRWFHRVFDPSGGHATHPVTGDPVDAPQKYWITKPFFEHQGQDYLNQRIENLMRLLANDPLNPTDPQLLKQLIAQVKDWRDNPFDPHLVAQYRTVAYQKFAVMKYLDNLVAWGDQQFTFGTLESVNIATQLYVVAAHLLGERPTEVPPPAKPGAETFNEIDDQLDAFSNALIQFENLVPPMPATGGTGATVPNLPSMLYFGVPQNDQLVKYWDVVEDRLFKIRHSLNIEGVFSPPVIFPPPINPLDLIKALAQGGDLSAAIADLSSPLPYYRFSVLLDLSNAILGDVKALGTSLLAALEKKDAEALAALRQGQEIALLQAVRSVKQKQVEDAELAIETLNKNADLVRLRRDYYASREFMSPGESSAMGLSNRSLALDPTVANLHVLAGALQLLPVFMLGAAGFGGSPTANAAIGGTALGGAASEAAAALSTNAASLDKAAAIASVLANYRRRMDDWQFQVRSADAELLMLEKQIASAEKRHEIAESELENHDLEIDNAQAIDAFMRDKYTNGELYQWQVGQISQTYFRSYNLAVDAAKKAEKCFRFELGREETSYVQSGYWNSLRSGLEAAEALQLDLRRMESDYRALDRREFECIKHVSLAMIDPSALLRLKSEGIATFELPEELFDLDFPGHYFRRIKSVSVTIPCVVGPYASVNATLRLLKNTIRIDTTGNSYAHNNEDGVPTDDDRFRQSNIRISAIAASGAQNDSGMFELDFKDDRYLPFEGAGAISAWQIELMQEKELRSFSYDSISDVILHVSYTAREDAGAFKARAIDNLRNVVTSTEKPVQFRILDLKREFGTEWQSMLYPGDGQPQVLVLPIGKRHFPFMAQNSSIHIVSATVFTRNSVDLSVTIDPPFDETSHITLPIPDAKAVYSYGSITGQDIDLDVEEPWRINLGAAAVLSPDDVTECYLVVGYALGISA